MGWNRAAVIGIAWFFLLAGSSTAQESAVKVRGCVLDRDGRPMKGVEVAPMWNVGEADGKQSGFGRVTTDDDGRFTVKVDFYGRDVVLMAIDSGRMVGGMALVPSRRCEARVRDPGCPSGEGPRHVRLPGSGENPALDQRLH